MAVHRDDLVGKLFGYVRRQADAIEMADERVEQRVAALRRQPPPQVAPPMPGQQMPGQPGQPPGPLTTPSPCPDTVIRHQLDARPVDT